jgi:hypothetical protein
MKYQNPNELYDLKLAIQEEWRNMNRMREARNRMRIEEKKRELFADLRSRGFRPGTKNDYPALMALRNYKRQLSEEDKYSRERDWIELHQRNRMEAPRGVGSFNF